MFIPVIIAPDCVIPADVGCGESIAKMENK
jgi:hypothetical protein